MMDQETVTIPKKEYERMLEEIGISRDENVMDSIEQNEEAKINGVRTWDLQPRE